MAKSYDRNSYSRADAKAARAARPTRRGSRRAGAPAPADNGAPSPVRPAVGQASPGAFRSAAGAPGGSAAPGGQGGNPYSRNSYRRDYEQQRKQRKRRRIIAVSLVVVLVLILGGAGAAFAYISGIERNLQSEVSDEMRAILADKTDPGEPFYMVLMGTDKSAERVADEGFAGDGFRTDSIMLLRVDPPAKKVAIVSLMRDTQVDMGVNGVQKLNAAYSIGGAEYTVQIVSQMAGVPISHYAEIDFDGFKDIVDSLGGVEVEVPMTIDDADAGGHLDAGLQTLNGEQALILCRSRHAFDEYGKGDEYRAANQRLVIGAIASKVLASDPATMVSTIEALSKHVTTDLGLTELMSLANNMRGMNMETDFYTAVNPTTSQYINDIWWEVMDENAWRTMMSRIDQGLPPLEESLVDEATGVILATAGDGTSGDSSTSGSVHRSGSVSVRNGSTIDGAAAAAQEKIGALGYTTNGANADSDSYAETLVIYNTADQAELAQEIVTALGVGRAVQNNGEYLIESDFLVVIGADWQ